MDITKAELPKKDVKTPKKEPQANKMTNGSRPASPEVGLFVHVLRICIGVQSRLCT